MPKSKRPSAGKFLANGQAIIILRNSGQVIAGATVAEKSFRVRTPDLGTLAFAIPKIQSIVYRNLPTYPVDVLKTVGGSEINGEVLNDPVHVRADDLGGAAVFPKTALLSIIF
jgi:hypothetical protein